MRNTFVKSLLEKAKQNDKILLLTGDLGYGVVDEFAKQLPNQFMNFGINEQTMMSAAAGLASQGFKPFVYSIGNFPTFRCLEQIRNDVCYMDLDVTIVALGAGFAYGTAGYSHHLIEDISAISPLPRIRIFSPADTDETARVVDEVVKSIGPKYVRLGKGGEGSLTAKFDASTFGISIWKRDPNIALVSTGNILEEVIKASEMNARSIPSIVSCYAFSELAAFLSNQTFTKLVVVEEHLERGGFGSLIRELPSFQKTDIESIAVKKIDTRISGDQAHLRNHYGLSSISIAAKLI
jgi:transketolase